MYFVVDAGPGSTIQSADVNFTDDAGMRTVSLQTIKLHSIWGFFDPQGKLHLFAVGDGGTILHHQGP